MPIDWELKGFSAFFSYSHVNDDVKFTSVPTGQHQNLGVNYSNQTERYGAIDSQMDRRPKCDYYNMVINKYQQQTSQSNTK